MEVGALALLDATDELLSSAAFVASYGIRLHKIFLVSASAPRPFVAAAFAEGALRLAIAESGDVMRTVVMLTPDDLHCLDPDYVERLPRLLGAALDVWGAEHSVGESLRRTLAELQLIPAAAASAAFESGLQQIRSAADTCPELQDQLGKSSIVDWIDRLGWLDQVRRPPAIPGADPRSPGWTAPAHLAAFRPATQPANIR